MGYIDNDGEINEDRYQEALEKQWDEEYEELNPEKPMDELLSRSDIFKDRLEYLRKLHTNGKISMEAFEDMRRTAAWHYSREPQTLGTGYMVKDQFSNHELVEGDTYFDGDYGDVTWNGKEWCSMQLTLVGEELLPKLKAI